MDRAVKKQELPIGADFVDNNGKFGKGEYAVFPICQWTDNKKDRFKFVGTAFFISWNGLFLTAKHNLCNPDGKLYDYLFAIHLTEGNKYFFREILNITLHDIADIAIGSLKNMKHKITGEALQNKNLKLDFSICGYGDMVATFAYPKVIIDTSEDNIYAKFNTNWEFGKIIEVFPNGRDKVMLPGPCYRSNLKIVSGTSGGPVANSQGKIIGVNSTGWDGTDDSYISMIKPILNFDLKNIVRINGKVIQSIKIEEIISMGLIPT